MGEITNEASEKLTEVFAGNAIKTIGDLVAAEGLEGLDDLPAEVRACPISMEDISVLPEAAHYQMKMAGIEPEAVDALVDKVVEFKVGMVEQALAALKP